jgi:hypothetical protein
VIELVDLLPRLNVEGDPQLQIFAAEVRNRLCTYSTQDLKKNPDLRIETAQQAATIVERISTVLENEREQTAPTAFASQSAQSVFERMSAYMGEQVA